MSTTPGLNPQGRSNDVIALLDKLAVRNQRDSAALLLIAEEALNSPQMKGIYRVDEPGAGVTIYALTKDQIVTLLKTARFDVWQPYDWLEMDESGIKGNDHRLDLARSPSPRGDDSYRRLVNTTLLPLDMTNSPRRIVGDGVTHFLFDVRLMATLLAEARFNSWSAKDWQPSMKTSEVLHSKNAALDVDAPPAPAPRRTPRP